MVKYVLLIVFEHEETPLPELDSKIGRMVLIEKCLPDNIIDYKIMAVNDS